MSENIHEKITIKVGGEGENEPMPRLSLVARRTMDGNIIVADHDIIDVIIQPNDKKIICFPKENMNDKVYDAQNRLFKFLTKKGVVSRETIQGGDIHGAIQAEYAEDAAGANSTQLALFNVGKWINEEKPYLETMEYFDEMGEKRLTEPSDEESTDLGDVPHEPEKGSVDPNKIRRYLAGYGYY